MGIECSRFHLFKQSNCEQTKSTKTVKSRRPKKGKPSGSSTQEDGPSSSKQYYGQEEAHSSECEENIYENTQNSRDKYRQKRKEKNHQRHGQETEENSDIPVNNGSQTREHLPKPNEIAEHMYVNKPQTDKMCVPHTYENTKGSDENEEDTNGYVSLKQINKNGHPHSNYESLHNNKACPIYDSAQVIHEYITEQGRNENNHQLKKSTRGTYTFSFFQKKKRAIFSNSFFRCRSFDNNCEKQKSRLGDIREEHGTSPSVRYQPAPPPPDILE